MTRKFKFRKILDEVSSNPSVDLPGLPIRVNRYYLEYAVLRLIGMSGLRLYKTAANEAVKISSYTPNTNRSQEQVLIKSSRTGTRV